MHSAATGYLAGAGVCNWQDDAYVLGCVGKSAAKARKAYLDYVPKPRTELARALETTVSGIAYAVRRGEIVVAREGYTLIDSVI